MHVVVVSGLLAGLLWSACSVFITFFVKHEAAARPQRFIRVGRRAFCVNNHRRLIRVGQNAGVLFLLAFPVMLFVEPAGIRWYLAILVVQVVCAAKTLWDFQCLFRFER